MDQLIKSIYDNYQIYKSIAESVLGKDSPFVDDVVSNCIIKIYDVVNSGRLSVEDLTYEDNGINQTYFKTMVMNAALNFKNKKENRITCYIDDKTSRIQDDEQDQTPTADIYEIQQFLQEYELKSSGNKSRADLFRMIYIEGKTLLYIHKQTGVHRVWLTAQKKTVLKDIRKWLNEKHKLRQ